MLANMLIRIHNNLQKSHHIELFMDKEEFSLDYSKREISRLKRLVKSMEEPKRFIPILNKPIDSFEDLCQVH